MAPGVLMSSSIKTLTSFCTTVTSGPVAYAHVLGPFVASSRVWAAKRCPETAITDPRYEQNLFTKHMHRPWGCPAPRHDVDASQEIEHTFKTASLLPASPNPTVQPQLHTPSEPSSNKCFRPLLKLRRVQPHPPDCPHRHRHSHRDKTNN